MPTEIVCELAVPSGGEGGGSDSSCCIGSSDVGLSGAAWGLVDCTDTGAYGDCTAGGIGDGWLLETLG